MTRNDLLSPSHTDEIYRARNAARAAERSMTKSQSEALRWLREHNGDGLFDHNGVVVAAGEKAPHTRSTWNALRKLGLVEFYQPRARGASRIRILTTGSAR